MKAQQLRHRPDARGMRPPQTARSAPQSGTLSQLSEAAAQSPAVQLYARLNRMAGTSDAVATQTRLQEAGTRLSASVKSGVTPKAAAPVQRAAIMPYELWKANSSKVAKKRSDKLLEVDAALIRYHATLGKEVTVQKAAADALMGAISDWTDAKVTKYGKYKSARKAAMEQLKDQVATKQSELAAIITKGKKYGSRTDFTFDAYNRVRGRVQAILSVATPRASFEAREHMVGGLDDLREQARDINPKHKPVDALWDACSVLIALAERHLRVNVNTANHASATAALKVYKPRFASSLSVARSYIDAHPRTAKRITTYLNTAENDVGIYSSIAGKDDASDPDLDLPEGYDEGMDLVGEGLNSLGMQGTGGKGNEGLEDHWKSGTISTTDPEKAQAQRNAAMLSSGLYDPNNPEAMDKLSGGADMGAGAVMAADVGAQLAKEIALLESLKGKKGGKAKRQRAGARMRIAKLSVLDTTAAIGKAEGGAMTALRGGDGSKMPKSSFFSSSGGRGPTDAEVGRGIDVSTDFKLAGDSASLLSGAVGAVTSLVDAVRDGVKRWKHVEGHSRSAAENAQAGFDTVHDIVGVTKKVSDTVSGITKLVFQIQGGGQVASESVSVATEMARGTVSGAPIIPIIGLIKGVLDFVKQAIKLGRVAIAARNAKSKAEDLAKTAGEALLSAFTVTKEKFTKQIHRAIIELIHAGTTIAAGALNVSGLGAGVGAALGMASSVAKLIQIGTRKFKQHKRDKLGGKLTNLEKSGEALAAGNDEFINRTLEKTEARLATGKRKGVFDKDKSTANKEFRYRNAAIEILRSPKAERTWFYEALGIARDVQKEVNKAGGDETKADQKAILALIIASFKAR